MSPDTTLIILALAFMAGLSTLIGVALALILGENNRAISIGMGFSAGIMLCISFIDLIPEALAISSSIHVWYAIILGVVLLAMLHYIIPHIHLFDEINIGPYTKPGLFHTALLVAIGLILHDLPEGFAMANAYVSSPNLGILVAISILLHNIPEQFAIALPAVQTHKPWFLFATAFLASLAEPVGAILGISMLYISPEMHAILLGFAAGAMIYVSLHELLPIARQYAGIRWSWLGILSSLFIYALLHYALV
jgi:ZIP family zinc transporter